MLVRRATAAPIAVPTCSRAPDRGAVAVEFALVLPLLMLFLCGVIQYGYGLFQLQSFSAALDQAGRDAATGIGDCASFDRLLGSAVTENGLSPADVATSRLEWLDHEGRVTQTPQRILGQVRITATYRAFDLGIPLVPFPDTITRSSTASVQSVLGSGLTGCLGSAKPS
ncbi:pilus assembly protein [Kineosporia rhizophila]|uniref:TadE/TadG family type IV pilus assembly protein n=1 Tax=Kineosporia rhizophila TaxID=84633 RepID=UPI001E32EAC6|nr:pilus assembly protein [Kineosporia rhizophila]